MELLLGEISTSADREYGEEHILWVVVKFIGLMKIVILQVDDRLEGNSSVRLNY